MCGPFLLKPAAKDYLWGGNRLNDDFAKNIELSPLAETWECSTHPDGESIVASGEYAGRTLKEVLKLRPEFIGTHPKTDGEGSIPVLIKLVDAKSDLSIQVHPSDEYAEKNEGGQLGKSEMWYVLDASRTASLVYGFKFDTDRGQIEDSIKKGTLEKYLQRVPVKKDDVFFIEAGTVHAIGAGALIAEIQENSNLTYRLYDYDRVDKNGNKRELHVKKALEVANFKSSAEPKQPMRVKRFFNGYCAELLYRCKYFQVEKYMVNTETNRRLARFAVERNSFQALLCTEGCGIITCGGESLNFFKGDCIFVPACSEEFSVHAKAQIIKITC